MKYFLPFILILCGCQNVSTTKLEYSDGKGGTVTLELPKEMDAKNLSVELNAEKHIAIIKADSMSTKNLEAIRAQYDAIGDVTAKAAKASVDALKAGILP